jgi:hypothetical protein
MKKIFLTLSILLGLQFAMQAQLVPITVDSLLTLTRFTTREKFENYVLNRGYEFSGKSTESDSSTTYSYRKPVENAKYSGYIKYTYRKLNSGRVLIAYASTSWILPDLYTKSIKRIKELGYTSTECSGNDLDDETTRQCYINDNYRITVFNSIVKEEYENKIKYNYYEIRASRN